MKAKQAGFTLVEIAIVLVIIGLLLGGVLKGQELINQARIKNITNDFNGITAAVYSYQDRYKALPGDDPNADGRWAGSGNGSNDGDVDPADVFSAAGETEATGFWRHLRQAGLITGDATSFDPPLNAVNGQITVINGVIGPPANANGLTRLIVCSAGVLGKLAEAVDSQVDDGRPNTGSLRTQANVAGGLYVDDGSTAYVVCKNL